MNQKAIFLFLLLLVLPALATNAGPLDGAWYDGHGNSVIINSEVVHATVRMQDRWGRSRVVRARYTGYTRLAFPTAQGSWGNILMLDRGRIRVIGGGFDGDYTR